MPPLTRSAAARLSRTTPAGLGTLAALPPEIIDRILDFVVEDIPYDRILYLAIVDPPVPCRGFSCVSYYALQLLNDKLQPIFGPTLEHYKGTDLSITGKIIRQNRVPCDAAMLEQYNRELEASCTWSGLDGDDDDEL